MEDDLSAADYEQMLSFNEALHSSLDLPNALEHALPLLQKLVAADHVALAISRPGTRDDFEWFNNTLPEQFLGSYATFANQDFVREAVVATPNRVLRDHEMISRRGLERNIMYASAREAGAKLEHVMAVMLVQQSEWSSGLSLYRSRLSPFSERDAAVLQRLVPQLSAAVSNARRHAELQRDFMIEPALAGAGVGLVWVDASGRERARTAQASALITQYFPDETAAHLPGELVEPLRRRRGPGPPAAWIKSSKLSCVHVSYVPLPGRATWAIVMRARGLTPELEARLSPRLLEITACILRGMSNEAIARLDGRSLATIKQQVSEVYARLGVPGRKGLIQLVWGQGV